MNFKFNYDRYSKWVAASMSWLRNDPDAITFTRIQGFGVIDAQLYDINHDDIHKVLDNNLVVYDHVNILSYLWVLGVYEHFRMMDQRIRETPDLADVDASDAIKNAKKEFERIRVPLAKLEKARRFNDDYSVPKLGADDKQLAWQINDSEIIYYRNLSDLALKTLNQLRQSNFKRNKIEVKGEKNSSIQDSKQHPSFLLSASEMKEFKVICNGVAELPNAAKELLKFADNHRVLAFYGKMGAGKTTFIKEICAQLGVTQNVSSPTFSLVNEYNAANGNPVYHFDFYRIKSDSEAMDIGCEEYFYSGHFCLVEWPEKVINLLPKETVGVFIEVLPDEQRLLNFKID